MRLRSLGRVAVLSGTAAALAIGTAGTGATASAAVAKPKPPSKHVFTPKKESFNAKDSVGKFHAQVKLRGKYPKYYPMPWSFQITNKKLKAIARGRMTCKAVGLNGKYHDTHVVAVGYVWHSKVGSKGHPHKAKKLYTLSGTCVFAVQVGGRPGKATVGFAFRYAIDPGKKKSVAAQSGSAVTTSVRITG